MKLYKCLAMLLILVIGLSCSSSQQNRDKDLSIYSAEDVDLTKQSGNWEEIINLCRTTGLETGLKLAGLHYGAQKWNSQFWSMVGDCYNLNQQLTKARIFYTKALTLQKHSPAALVGLSTIMAKFDNPYESLNLLNVALNHNPSSDLIRWSLGQFYLAWGLNGVSLKQLLKVSSNFRTTMVNRSIAMNYALMENERLAFDLFKSLDSDVIDVNLNSRFLYAFVRSKVSGNSIDDLSNSFQFESQSPLTAFLEFEKLKNRGLNNESN
jgi:hypothetical protein